MKVLFTTQPLSGHWHPLVPFARALEDAGHDVAIGVHGCARHPGRPVACADRVAEEPLSRLLSEHRACHRLRLLGVEPLAVDEEKRLGAPNGPANAEARHLLREIAFRQIVDVVFPLVGVVIWSAR